MIPRPEVLRRMRAPYNAFTCLGCGHPSEDPYSFCGKCISEYSESRRALMQPARPRLPLWKSIVFWLAFLGVLALAWYVMIKIALRHMP